MSGNASDLIHQHLYWNKTKQNKKCIIQSWKANNGHFLKSNVVILLLQVREHNQVMMLTSSQEEQLLRDINHSDTFHRKMTAHGILYNLHYFLVDCRRVIVNKRAKHRDAAASRVMTAVTFYHQKLKM